MEKFKLDLEFYFKKVEKSVELYNKMWENADNNEDDYAEKACYLSDYMEKRILRNNSLGIISKNLDLLIKRNKNQKFDVTKIFVSEKTNESLKDYDFRILKLYKTDYTDKFLNKEVSWMHFFSGPSIKKDIEDDYVYFDKEKILKEENIND